MIRESSGSSSLSRGAGHGPASAGSSVYSAVVENADDLVDGVVPALDRLDNASLCIRREHDLMDDVCLLNFTEDCAGLDFVASFHERLEGPFLLMGEAGRRDTALDEVAHLVHEDGEGPLDPIVDTGQEPGAEFDCQGADRVLVTGSPGRIPEVSSYT